MSVTVNIIYSGENDNAQKFAQEMLDSGTVAQIRAEEGNLRYEYFQPLEDKQSILLIDAWKSQESIDLHHKTEMMKTIASLRKKYQLHMKVTRYTEIENEVSVKDL